MPLMTSAATVDVEPLADVVVEEEQRLRALDQDVVDAHRDEIDADRVVAAERERELQLGADAVGARHQHGLAIALRQLDQRAESADAGQHLRAQRPLRERLDPLDERVAGVDVDAGIRGTTAGTAERGRADVIGGRRGARNLASDVGRAARGIEGSAGDAVKCDASPILPDSERRRPSPAARRAAWRRSLQSDRTARLRTRGARAAVVRQFPARPQCRGGGRRAGRCAEGGAVETGVVLWGAPRRGQDAPAAGGDRLRSRRAARRDRTLRARGAARARPRVSRVRAVVAVDAIDQAAADAAGAPFHPVQRAPGTRRAPARGEPACRRRRFALRDDLRTRLGLGARLRNSCR